MRSSVVLFLIRENSIFLFKNSSGIHLLKEDEYENEKDALEILLSKNTNLGGKVNPRFVCSTVIDVPRGERVNINDVTRTVKIYVVNFHTELVIPKSKISSQFKEIIMINKDNILDFSMLLSRQTQFLIKKLKERGILHFEGATHKQKHH